MAHPHHGDVIRIHYTGRLDDGSVFGSSRDQEPMQLTLGEHQVIPRIEETLSQMETGQTVTVTIPAGEAYGPVREDLMVTVDRANIPENVPLAVDQRLQVQTKDGESAVVKIAAVSDDQVVLDANHPLAGEDLTFDLELVEVLAR